MTKAANLAALAQGPTFSAYQSSAQTLSGSTWTKLQLQTEEFDTANAFDSTTNYRFQPQVAGYYLFNGGLQVGTSQTNTLLGLYKNGGLVKTMQYSYNGQSGTYGSAFVYLNGSTDYVEFYAYITIGQNLATGSSTTFFSGALLRAA
jgi:hypothetical protein